MTERTQQRYCFRRGTAVIAAVLLAAASVWSGDSDAYTDVLRRFDMVNAELESIVRRMDCPEPLPEYPGRLLSLRRNASVTIGGEMRLNYIGTRSRPLAMNLNPAASRVRNSAKLGSFGITAANVDLDILAGERWRAYFGINLNGYHGINRIERYTLPDTGLPYSRSQPIDHIDAAYIELLKAGHSGLGLRAGIMQLPFGLSTRPDLIGKSFLDAPHLTQSYLGAPESWSNAILLPHASRTVDPVTAAELTYEMRDIIRFQTAMFQDTAGSRTHSRGGRVRRYRTDSALPLSWQAGFSILPLEGWELSAHFRNRYSASRGMHDWTDSPYRWDFSQNLAGGSRNPAWDPGLGNWSASGTGPGFGARRNEQSFIVGLAVEIPNTNLSVQAEYAHGWNQGFNKYINSDDVNIGLSYRLTPFLTLHAQGEWLHVKDRSWMGESGAGTWSRDTRNNRLYRGLFGAEYELARGLTLEAGWQYEYWCLTSGNGGAGGANERRVNTANTVYMGTRFIF